MSGKQSPAGWRGRHQVNRRVETCLFRVVPLDKSSRNPLALIGMAEHNGTSAKAAACKARSERAGGQGRFRECIQRRATDAEVVAQAGVPRIQDAPELLRIGPLKRNHGLVDARRFRNHVQKAPPLNLILKAGDCEPLELDNTVLLYGLRERLETKPRQRP
jgi:hypothetical protein